MSPAFQATRRRSRIASFAAVTFVSFLFARSSEAVRPSFSVYGDASLACVLQPHSHTLLFTAGVSCSSKALPPRRTLALPPRRTLALHLRPTLRTPRLQGPRQHRHPRSRRALQESSSTNFASAVARVLPPLPWKTPAFRSAPAKAVQSASCQRQCTFLRPLLGRVASRTR